MEYQEQPRNLADMLEGSTGGSAVALAMQAKDPNRDLFGVSLPQLVNQNSVVRNNTQTSGKKVESRINASGVAGKPALYQQRRGYSGVLPGGSSKDQHGPGRRGYSLANQSTHNTGSRLSMPNKTASSFVGKDAGMSSQLPPKSNIGQARGTTGHSVRQLDNRQGSVRQSRANLAERIEDKAVSLTQLSNSMRFRSQKKQGLDVINPLDELASSNQNCTSPVKIVQYDQEALKAINEASEDQIKVLAAQRLKERNQKYLEDLAKKRARQVAQNDQQQNKAQEHRVKVREQVAKKNAEMIKQRLEAKQKEEEVQKKVEEEKKENQVALAGPSQEFLDRLNKSKQKQPPITDWKKFRKFHNLEENRKIFICSNAYKPLIQELEARGWFRNKDRQSLIFHLKFVILESESSMIKDELEKWQIINHFYRNNLLTTKVGLQNSLQNLVWWSNIPQDQFFPKCFDLTDLREQDDFLEEFKVNRAENLLKKFKRKKQCPSNIEKLLVAIFISEKRLSDVDDIIDDEDLQTLVNDAEWQIIAKEKFTDGENSREELLKANWYRKIQVQYQHLCEGELVTGGGADSDEIEEESNEESDPNEKSEDEAEEDEEEKEQSQSNANKGEKDAEFPEPMGSIKSSKMASTPKAPPKYVRERDREISEFKEIENKLGNFKALHDYVVELCKRLKERFTQYNMNGTENLWLLKPGSSSRGRGIKVYKTYEKVLNRIKLLKGNTRLWVVQKCIENPLIVENRKFDIRQWVLVTDWNPLTVWCYKESYVRFCVQEYDPKGDSRKNHLTNNSVQKKYADFADTEIDGNMWSSTEFADHLEEQYGDDRWTDKIWPQIKQYTKASLQSVQENMDNRKNSFEFFGYDFMVDTEFRVWLIEVNSSPSMDMGTPTTAYLVQKVLADLPKVILDYPKARNQKKCDTGGFTCIYRAGFEVGRPQGVNVNSLICEGTALKPPKKAKKAPAQPTKTVTKPVQS